MVRTGIIVHDSIPTRCSSYSDLGTQFHRCERDEVSAFGRLPYDLLNAHARTTLPSPGRYKAVLGVHEVLGRTQLRAII